MVLCVALVDEDRASRQSLQGALESLGYEVFGFESASEALSAAHLPEVCCVSESLPGADGQRLIQRLRERDPDKLAILLSSLPETEAHSRALASGAHDVLSRGACREQVELRVGRALQFSQLKRSSRSQSSFRSLPPELWGESEPMLELFSAIDRASKAEAPVLLIGEPGTGKRVVARQLHSQGPGANRGFLVLDCTETNPVRHFGELFGATPAAPNGLFDRAGGGVLYLADVGWLSLTSQAELVERYARAEVVPRLSLMLVESAGHRTDGPVDAPTLAPPRLASSLPRLVCGSAVDLQALLRTGQLSPQFAALFQHAEVRLPPLRERRGDIPSLVTRFIARLAADSGRPQNQAGKREPPQIREAALEALSAYAWPGNVTELSHTLARALLASQGDCIELEDLPASVRSGFDVPDSGLFAPPNDDTVVPLRELERRAIVHALKVARGNVGRAAALLGIGRATLYRRLAEGGQEPASSKRAWNAVG